MTLAEFCKKNAITITSVPVALRETDRPKSFRYKVEIHYAGKSVTTDYFCGSGYVGIPRSVATGELNGNGSPVYKKTWKMLSETELRRYEKGSFSMKAGPIPPQIEDVMNCLLSDFSLLESAPFWPEYAFELGLNVDSVKERNTYDASVNQFLAFRKMLGYGKTHDFLGCDGL